MTPADPTLALLPVCGLCTPPPRKGAEAAEGGARSLPSGDRPHEPGQADPSENEAVTGGSGGAGGAGPAGGVALPGRGAVLCAHGQEQQLRVVTLGLNSGPSRRRLGHPPVPPGRTTGPVPRHRALCRAWGLGQQGRGRACRGVGEPQVTARHPKERGDSSSGHRWGSGLGGRLSTEAASTLVLAPRFPRNSHWTILIVNWSEVFNSRGARSQPSTARTRESRADPCPPRAQPSPPMGGPLSAR